MTAAVHTATLVIERDKVRVKFTCHCGEADQCRQQVADYSTCHCETYTAQQLPDGSWGHIVYRDDVHEFRPIHKFLLGRTLNGVAHCDLCDGRRELSSHIGVPGGCAECDEVPEAEVHTADEEVWHPMKPGRECNYLTWIEADCSAEELYCGPTDAVLHNSPVEFIWTDGDHYEWQPATGTAVQA